MSPRPLLASALSLGLCFLSAGTAFGYAEDIHAFIAQTALQKSGLSGQTALIPPAAPHGLRAAIDAYARGSAAPEIRQEWVRRYPTPAAFDAWAEKELLLFEPSAQVYGIDRFAQAGDTQLSLVVHGSREPDDDWRNRERHGYDDKRQPLHDQKGGFVPADPALLNMGQLGSLSSQAHAHYGLAQVQFSEDPEVLKTDPRRFAVPAGYRPGPILTLAAEMAQEHLDLSLLAALLPEGPSPELSWLHTGQGFHYLEDVGNQIHTVQVGLYDFFVDAFKARLLMAAYTGGGYFGHLRSLSSIGIDILSNHHVLSEMLTRKRVLEGVAGKTSAYASLIAAPAEDDPAFAAHLDQALSALGQSPERGEFALAITRAMIEDSSHEGADVYSKTRAIAIPRLRKEGEHFDDVRDDPDDFVSPQGPGSAATYREFFALQERAFHRCGTALRRWVQLEQKALAQAVTPQDRETLRMVVLDRLVRRQLGMLREAEARRAEYLAHPPSQMTTPERMPGVLAAEVVVAVLLIGGVALLLRRRRRVDG